MCGTYRDFHTPEFPSHLASHLQRNLCSYSHECLRSAEGTGHHTLAGSGAIHTKELLNAVILILPVVGEDYHHLTNRNTLRSGTALGNVKIKIPDDKNAL